MAQRRHQEAPHLSLEEICLQMGFLSEEDFRKVLDETSGWPRLGGLLVKEGIINESQLARALAVQRRSGGLIGQILLRMGCFDEDKLVEVLGRQFKVPFVPVGSLRPDRSLRRVLNATYALRHGVVPVALAGRRLTVAISDPSYKKPLDELSSLTGYEVDVVLTTPTHVDKMRTLLYAEEEEPEEAVTEEIPVDGVFKEVDLPAPVKSPEEPEALLESLLGKALEESASSIHLDPGEHGPRLLFRVEGQLQDFGTGELGTKVILHYRAMIRRLKSLAKMDLVERRRPQEGWLRVEKIRQDNSETTSFHLTIIPTRFGESVTLRVVAGGRPPRTLDGLGFSENVSSEIREVLQWPHGIFLVVAPNAAGKSSTLWACAQWLERAGRKVAALTTQPGYSIPNVVQFELGGELPVTLDTVLGYFANSDPDVIIVDEIQSAEMASQVMEWARSGRMVIASVTALSARSAMGYLRSLGVDVELFAEYLSAILGQRLLRCICPDCAVPAERETAGSVLLDEILPQEGDWKESVGCAVCRQTGLLGRIPVSELWFPHRYQGQSEDAHNRQSPHPSSMRWDPMVLFKQHVDQVTCAAHWVAQGRTTPEELLRSFALWELLKGRGTQPVPVGFPDEGSREGSSRGESHAA
jgi:type II secretory ATPase GspE/PulE/Tfp pilus assembly ATPase PilB-like protein